LIFFLTIGQTSKNKNKKKSLNTKGNHKYFDINSILHFESSNQRIRVEDDHQRIDQISKKLYFLNFQFYLIDFTF